jgi:hypothetical protein
MEDDANVTHRQHLNDLPVDEPNMKLTLLYDAKAKIYDLHIAGVKVLSYLDDNGIFIRRVMKAADLPRMKDAGVQVPVADNRVLVY